MKNVIAGVLIAAGSVAIGTLAALASTAGPRVTSAVATPYELPADGGSVTVHYAVKHATSCSVKELRGQVPLLLPRATKCTSGSYTAKFDVPQNGETPRTFALEIVASRKSDRAVGKFYIGQAAAPPIALVAPPQPAPPSVSSFDEAPSSI